MLPFMSAYKDKFKHNFMQVLGLSQLFVHIIIFEKSKLIVLSKHELYVKRNVPEHHYPDKGGNQLVRQQNQSDTEC